MTLVAAALAASLRVAGKFCTQGGPNTKTKQLLGPYKDNHFPQMKCLLCSTADKRQNLIPPFLFPCGSLIVPSVSSTTEEQRRKVQIRAGGRSNSGWEEGPNEKTKSLRFLFPREICVCPETESFPATVINADAAHVDTLTDWAEIGQRKVV